MYTGDFSTISIFTAQVPVFIAVTVQGVVKGAGLKRATQGKRTFFCGGAILCIHNPDTLSGGCHPRLLFPTFVNASRVLPVA